MKKTLLLATLALSLTPALAADKNCSTLLNDILKENRDLSSNEIMTSEEFKSWLDNNIQDLENVTLNLSEFKRIIRSLKRSKKISLSSIISTEAIKKWDERIAREILDLPVHLSSGLIFGATKGDLNPIPHQSVLKWKEKVFKETNFSELYNDDIFKINQIMAHYNIELSDLEYEKLSKSLSVRIRGSYISDAVNSVFALSKYRRDIGQKMLESLEFITLNYSDEFSSQDISTLLYALSGLHHDFSEEWLATMYSMAYQHLDEMNYQDLSFVLASFNRFGLTVPKRFYEKALPIVEKNYLDYKPITKSTIAIALAMGHVPLSKEFTKVMFDDFVQEAPYINHIDIAARLKGLAYFMDDNSILIEHIEEFFKNHKDNITRESYFNYIFASSRTHREFSTQEVQFSIDFLKNNIELYSMYDLVALTTSFNKHEGNIGLDEEFLNKFLSKAMKYDHRDPFQKNVFMTLLSRHGHLPKTEDAKKLIEEVISSLSELNKLEFSNTISSLSILGLAGDIRVAKAIDEFVLENSESLNKLDSQMLMRAISSSNLRVTNKTIKLIHSAAVKNIEDFDQESTKTFIIFTGRNNLLENIGETEKDILKNRILSFIPQSNNEELTLQIKNLSQLEITLSNKEKDLIQTITREKSSGISNTFILGLDRNLKSLGIDQSLENVEDRFISLAKTGELKTLTDATIYLKEAVYHKIKLPFSSTKIAVEKIIENIDQLHGEDLEKTLLALYELNYPVDGDQLSAFLNRANEIINYLHPDELSKLTNTLVTMGIMPTNEILDLARSIVNSGIVKDESKLMSFLKMAHETQMPWTNEVVEKLIDLNIKGHAHVSSLARAVKSFEPHLAADLINELDFNTLDSFNSYHRILVTKSYLEIVKGIKTKDIPKTVVDKLEKISEHDTSSSRFQKGVSNSLTNILGKDEVIEEAFIEEIQSHVDFLIPSKKIIVEANGPSHYLRSPGKEDILSSTNIERREVLKALGYKVKDIHYLDYRKNVENKENFIESVIK